MATIKEIAQLAGVSVATVSYVINDTRYVSPERKERVLKAIKELNYVPNAMARGLRVKATKTLGLLLTDITNPFYPDLAKGSEDIAHSMGYSVVMFNTNEEENRLSNAATQLREGKLDGLIIASARKRDEGLLKELISEGYPIVLAHRKVEGLQVDSVVADNRSGMAAAVRYLISLGHHKIYMFTGTEDSFVNQVRKESFLKTIEEAGTGFGDMKLIHTNNDYELAYNNAMKMMLEPEDARPSAVICINDMVALGVLDAVEDLGLQVPSDLAVIGFEDLFFSSARRIQLTSVRVPRYEIGKQATKMLLDRIADGKKELEELVIETDLIIRKTCGRRDSTKQIE